MTVALAGLLALSAGPAFAQTAAQTTTQTPSVLDAPELVQQFQETITPDDLRAHLYLFADDLFEGRETTTRGQKLAAAYLASQYMKLGLEPKGTVSEDAGPLATFYQPFTVYGRAFKGATLMMGGETVSTFAPEEQTGNAYLTFGNRAEVSAPVVFGGFGMANETYDDFAAMAEAGIDYEDKWLMMLSGSLADLTDASSDRNKIRTLFRRGLPKGMLIVAGPDADVPAATARALTGQTSGVGSLSLEEPGGGFAFPPVYVISPDLADQILSAGGRSLDDTRDALVSTMQPVVFEVGAEATLSSSLTYETRAMETENVIAYLEGSDAELKDEVVVLTSHYDHIGIDLTREGDQINNGADDDGSGTVSLIEIAEAFVEAKKAGYGPRRSILFMNVSGEEKGLLGSAYYADQEPMLPLEQTVANLNIDMIGRFDPSHPTKSENYVYIIGSNLISQELHDLNAQVNTLTGVDIELDERFNSKDDPNQFYRRSDHWNFGKHNIPFIFYFTGTHEDYHQPGDEAHKVEYDRMARIARLIFATAWQVANQDERPAVSGTGFN
ncbi:MAG: M28 family peptidase [Bacteroidota bacterium]